MSFPPFLRALSVGRRMRTSIGTAAADGRVRIEPDPRHPAMSGLDVSPVHGHYCICDRCARQVAKPR